MAKPEETKESLLRIQQFQAQSLARKEDLGRLSFEAVVEPAQRVIRLYGQLSPSVLEDIPENHLEAIKKQADGDFNRFQQILNFDLTKDPSPAQTRDNLVQQVREAYNGTFNNIYPFISYGVSKSVDFRRMETEARAMIQSVQDHAALIAKELEKAKTDAEAVLADVRKAAAEQGVTQQAIYFKDEADSHEARAEEWRLKTVKLAAFLGVFAFASLWLHTIPGLDPATPMRAAQIATSKILIFVVISYMLLLAAKNFLAHRHNAIVNRHRQNALMTFKAIADAAKSGEAKDIVLSHAAACIFAPQETGYSKVSSSLSLNKSIIELLPKSSLKSGG